MNKKILGLKHNSKDKKQNMVHLQDDTFLLGESA